VGETTPSPEIPERTPSRVAVELEGLGLISLLCPASSVPHKPPSLISPLALYVRFIVYYGFAEIFLDTCSPGGVCSQGTPHAPARHPSEVLALIDASGGVEPDRQPLAVF